MGRVRAHHQKRLEPYLERSGPNSSGEWGMHCPFHDDRTRSASLNIETGLWYCQVCELGGGIDQLMSLLDSPPETKRDSGPSIDEEDTPSRRNAKKITDAQVEEWHLSLMRKVKIRSELMRRRAINERTLRRFEIGWDSKTLAYTIPIRDAEGEIVNVRRYQLDPPDDRRKIWSVAGMGTPTLYPIEELENNELIICEGEWDAISTIERGFHCITRTGAADVWKSQWNELFRDKVIYVCHDADVKGQKANRDIAHALRDVAAEIYVVTLPFEYVDKHGQDLSDLWVGHRWSTEDFKEMLRLADRFPHPADVTKKAEPQDVSVLDSFSSDLVGKPLRMRVTITGKRNPTYLAPSAVTYACTQDAGTKCQICPMNELGGLARREIPNEDPVVLEFLGSSNKQVRETLRSILGAQKCDRLRITVDDHTSVEELHVRPSVEQRVAWGEAGDYTNRKIISVGRHDTLPNNTVEMVGAIYPNPTGQQNEFQAWEVLRTETSIDQFKMTKGIKKELKKFQPRSRQSPLAKIAEISRSMAQNVTRIYGRDEMHAFMDLVLHSVLSFEFSGTIQERGWLDGLIVGDTRTGKSEAAQRLLWHYGAGEMISCESASFAGIVGGLQQFGSGKEWEVTWGAIPINDRRAVVLDEVSGLHTDQIAQMSSIRSSGQAQLTKIRSESTWARTRLLWLANPRSGSLNDFTWGIQSLVPLIGNMEDIARFDLAMAVRADEVSADEINKARSSAGDLTYDSESCHHLLLWAWSRKPDQIKWEGDAQDVVYQSAIDMGKRYVEKPPLIQAANVRMKIARIAVALAARTFSSDRSGEVLIVKPAHVRDAVRFMDLIYGKVAFGYKAFSQEVIEDFRESMRKRDEAKQYLVTRRGLAKFLRSMGGRFRRQDMEDMMNMSREEANATIGSLWKFRMVSREGQDIKVNPALHELLREVQE